MVKTFLTVAILSLTLTVSAQKEGPRSGYNFETISELKVTPVKNQQSTGTCWCYATISFLESELLRMGKPEYDLSEMFVVKNTYNEKGMRYFRFDGNTNFSEGGQAHDVMLMIKKYGIVPESVYDGLKYGSKYHIHGEMTAALKGMLDGINKNPNNKITPVWPVAYSAVIDTYLGKTPEKFNYEGKEYTPTSFSSSLGINPDDYVELTSYKDYPFYSEVELEIPDNWTHSRYYNIPLDDLIAVMNNSLKNGYTLCWDGDVSEQGFGHGSGLAIMPTDQTELMVNSEISKWQNMSAKERKNQLYSFESPVPELKVTDDNRQETFNSRQSTDDHLMHITGMAKDQYGTIYYKTKNSWAETSNSFGGYLYMSEPYCRLKTVAIMVHKNAIPKEMKKKLNLQ